MSSDFHTPIPHGANADDTVFNAPLGELDQALFDMVEGNLPFDKAKAGAGAPEASSMLEVNSTTQGFLPPRMNQTQRDAIASPTEGLVIYNTDDNAPNYYNGGWISLLPIGDAMQLILPETAIASSTEIIISGIGQGYQDLLLRLRLQLGSGAGRIRIRFNNASGASDYSWVRNELLFGDSAILVTEDQSDTGIELVVPIEGAAAPEQYADYLVFIRDYTLVEKHYGNFEGVTWNAFQGYEWGDFEFSKSEAINEINIVPTSPHTISGSYALYGIGKS